VAKNNLSATLHALGVAQTNRGVLPTLAIEVAKAARKGTIKPDNALDVYLDYYRASSRLKTIDPYDNGIKANVSKLRQIILCADPELLERVTNLHEKALNAGHYVKPLYHAMVLACRAYNARPHKLTNGEIIKIIRRTQ
jgi:hypothetical protein